MQSMFLIAHLKRLPFLCSMLICAFMTAPAFGQNATLRGAVTDQTGAIIPGATIVLSDPAGASHSVTSDPGGNYLIGGVIPGPYTLNASAPDMVLSQPLRLNMKAGTQTLNLKLQVQTVVQKLNVEAEGIPSVSTDATNNA